MSSGAPPALRVEDFGFTSRGDRVKGRLLRSAERAGARPLLFWQWGGSLEGLERGAADWAAAGAVVAAIDLPLHGSRADQKLTRSLAAGGALAAALAREVAKQSLGDLERALDVLLARDEIDAGRVAFVGTGAAGPLAAALCARDPRPGALVFERGSASDLPELDPEREERLRPNAARPLQVIEAAPVEAEDPRIRSFLRLALALPDA